MYVITGATSRTGSVVANYLIEKGQQVKVLIYLPLTQQIQRR
ncbi:MAG: hypothetical protein K0Q75_2096 [Anaerospora sp.]|nr:hypothetical protein [Anaerospora sp.]